MFMYMYKLLSCLSLFCTCVPIEHEYLEPGPHGFGG